MAVSADQRASDVAFVVSEFPALYGRQPSQYEINHVADALENGSYTRERWVAESQPGGDPNATVIRIYTEVVGKPPTNQAGIDFYAQRLANGNMTQEQVRAEMAAATAANRQAQGLSPTGPNADQEDAKAYLQQQLNSWGLGSLSDFAWNEIQKGYGMDRVIQDLRNTPEYQARFPAMKLRQQQGLPPLTEQQYIEYEGQARDIMRSNGMPPGFWDAPSDYTALLANDISPQELQDRVQNDWLKVQQAPPEVRNAFASFFGPSGDAALAAYFLDPSKAEEVLTKAVNEAQISGFANIYGMNVGLSRADQLLSFGKTPDQVVAAYSQLGTLSPLFEETVSENTDLTKEQEGLNATLGLDATSEAALQKRARTRTVATSGGGGAAISSQGVAAGAAE